MLCRYCIDIISEMRAFLNPADCFDLLIASVAWVNIISEVWYFHTVTLH